MAAKKATSKKIIADARRSNRRMRQSNHLQAP
jgi:hypothetical protein